MDVSREEGVERWLQNRFVSSLMQFRWQNCSIAPNGVRGYFTSSFLTVNVPLNPHTLVLYVRILQQIIRLCMPHFDNTPAHAFLSHFRNESYIHWATVTNQWPQLHMIFFKQVVMCPT